MLLPGCSSGRGAGAVPFPHAGGGPRCAARSGALRHPQAEQTCLALDNWPMKYHPDVLAALDLQQTRRPLRTPPHGPSGPSARAAWLGLPIQLPALPPHASRLNPQEKVWCQFQQAAGAWACIATATSGSGRSSTQAERGRPCIRSTLN
jgi:hypothetical protein